jgi:hypothetical protein
VVDLAILVLAVGVGLCFRSPDQPARYIRNVIEYLVPWVFVTFRDQYLDGPKVLGYADRHSVNAGEEFCLMLSTHERGLSVSGHL